MDKIKDYLITRINELENIVQEQNNVINEFSKKSAPQIPGTFSTVNGLSWYTCPNRRCGETFSVIKSNTKKPKVKYCIKCGQEFK